MTNMNQDDDSNWREYNIHGTDDDADQPFDIFASSTDDDAYETIQYDIDNNITINIRSEKDYDKSTGIAYHVSLDGVGGHVHLPETTLRCNTKQESFRA